MVRDDDKINRNEIRLALIRSGYLLECRVEAYLRDNWGYVEANPTYEDHETSKSREYDVYAMKAYSVGPSDKNWLFGILLIECINNLQPLLIMTKEPQVAFLNHQDIKLSGLPVKVLIKPLKEWRSLVEYLNMDKFHHYCKGREGTQFCSFTKKKMGRVEEWMALHEDFHFESFKKLCDVTEYNIDKHFKSWFPAKKEFVNVQMYFPVIIVQGELIDARQTIRSVTLRSSNHIRFRRSVTQGGRDVNYQIDVIKERFLPNYVSMINQEMQKIAKLFNQNNKIIQNSIEQILSDAIKDNGIENIRDIFDF